MKHESNSVELFEAKKCRKAINFDLCTDMLKKLYNTSDPFVYLKAYREIGSFLKQEGFTHRQWSGYVSDEKLSDVDVFNITYKLNNALPWLRQCVNKFDVTDIGEQHDLMCIFEKATEPMLNEKVPEHQTTNEKRSEMRGIISRSNIKANSKMIASKQHAEHKPERNNDKSR